MSIRNTQIKKATNKIVKNMLESNVIPDKRALTEAMYEYFNESEPGVPTFKGLSVDRKSLTDPEEYYQALDQIKWDLDILFQELIRKNENFIIRQIEQDVNRKKMIHDVKKTKAQLAETLEVTKNRQENINLDEYIFTNYNHYDPNSTAFIDLKHKNLKLSPRLYKTSSKTIEDISIDKVTPRDKVHTEEIMALKGLANDYNNKSWIFKIEPDSELKDEIEEISVSLLVKLADKRPVNQIELISNAREKETVNISLSVDGQQWTTIENATGNNILETELMYYFEPYVTQYAYITISKNFTEMEDGATFLFSLKDISFYDMKYDKDNFIKTKVNQLPPGETVDKIKIDADEKVPYGTDVSYYITAYSNNNKEKHQIFPLSREEATEDNQEINLYNTNEHEVRLQNNKQKSHLEELDRHNKRFYTVNSYLERLPGEIVSNEIYLFKGIDQWSKEVYQYYREDDHRVSIDDWTDIPVNDSKIICNYHNQVGGNKEYIIRQFINYEPSKEYYPLKYRYINKPDEIKVKRLVGNVEANIDNFEITNLASDISNEEGVWAVSNIDVKRNDIVLIEYPASFLNFKFTRFFYCNNPQAFESNTVNLPSFFYDELFEKDAFYLNNRRLPRIHRPDGHYFRGHVNEGWNRIDYLCYIDSPEKTTNSQGFLSDNVINFEKETDVWGDESESNTLVVDRSRSQKDSMEHTNIYTLRNKTPKNETNKFSLFENVNGNDVVVNTPATANYKVVYKSIENYYDSYDLTIELETEDHNFTPEVESVDVKFSY